MRFLPRRPRDSAGLVAGLVNESGSPGAQDPQGQGPQAGPVEEGGGEDEEKEKDDDDEQMDQEEKGDRED